MSNMTVRVGIRDLQHNTSQIIRHVKAGQTVEVTERGRLVAVLSPPTAELAAREELVTSGRLTPGKGGLGDWQPLPPCPGLPPLTEVLAELRDEEER